MNFNFIYLLIGFLTGIIISIFAGIITLSKGIVLSISVIIITTVGRAIPNIINEEFKRWMNKKEEREKDFKTRFRNHTIDQIIPMFENFSDIRLIPRNIWRDLTFSFALHDIEHLSGREYYVESIEHLKYYNDSWNYWLELNQMITEYNEFGDVIFNMFLDKVSSFIKIELPDFIQYDETFNLTPNSYDGSELAKRVVFQRLYEHIYGESIEFEYYHGEIRQYDANNYSLMLEGREAARGEEKKISILSDICYKIGRNFVSLFSNEIEEIKKLQKLRVSLKEKYEQYQIELKRDISKIKAGDPLLGKCVICEDWLKNE